MRLLVDTHVLLSIADPRTKALGAQFRTMLEAPDAEVWASVASLWEIAIKWRLHKLSIARPPDAIPAMLANSGIALLPITADHALTWVEPEPLTRDPFDRLLLGQCAVEGLRLLTTDRALVGHPLSATAE